MFQSSNKHILGETTQDNFSFFSSKKEGSTDRHRVETPETTFNPMFSQVLCPVKENSPDLDMMVNQLLMTPEQSNRQHADVALDSVMEEEFKNFESNGENWPMSVWNTSMIPRCPEVDEKTCRSKSFLASKYLKGFGSEPVNWSHGNETSVMLYDTSPRQTDSSFASSRESSLSISSTRNISISPSIEFSGKARKIVSSANSAQTCEKEIPVKFASARARFSQKSNIHCKNQDHGHEVVNTKKRGNQVRGNRLQRWSKQTNFRPSTDKRKSLHHKGLNRLVPKNCQVSDKHSPAWTNGYNNKRFYKKGNRASWAREISARVLTLGDALKMLMNKPNMFLAFVTDQEGSRFLQQHLTSATNDQLWSTFNHLQSHFVTISQDVFGNYVAQKYLELGSDKLRGAILENLETSIPSLSLGMYGCRVVQKLLECGTHEHKLLVAKQFTGSIIKFVYDQNGNHVVQKIVQYLNPNEIGFVVNEISGYTYNLAIHPYGSRVIQRLLGKVSRCVARPLLDEIKKHTVALSKNQYGNYIIQWIIKHCVKERREVIVKLIGRVSELSREKCASNVIEQAIKRSTMAQISELAEELLKDETSQTEKCSKLALLVNDQFGNYVIQTLLDSSSGAFRQRLVSSLRTCSQLKKQYGTNLPLRIGPMSRRDSDVKK